MTGKPGILEDFTTYTEEDPNNEWSQTSTRNTATNLRRDSDSYVYKSYGSGHFGDFEHLIDFRITSAETSGYQGIWALTNTPESMADLPSGSLVVEIQRTPTNYLVYLRECGVATDSWGEWSVGTTYYLTIKRVGTSLTCKIYSDSARTNLLGTLSLTVSTTTFEYLQCGFGAKVNGLGYRLMSGYCENLDLQERLQTFTENVSVIGDILIRRVHIEDITAQLGIMSDMVREALEQLEEKIKRARAKFSLRR